MSKTFNLAGQILFRIIELVTKFAKPIVAILLGLLLLSFASTWVGTMVALFAGWEVIPYVFEGGNGLAYLAVFSLLTFIGIPFLLLLLLGARMIFNTKVRRGGVMIMLGIWLLSFGGMIFAGFQTAKSFAFSGNEQEEVFFQMPSDESLKIKYSGILDFEVDHDFGDMKIHDGKVLGKSIHLSFEKSPDDQYHVFNHKHSQGRSDYQARENARKVTYDVNFSGNTMSLPAAYFMGDAKFRGQEVTVEVQVPEGKSIFLDESVGMIIGQIRTPNGIEYLGHHELNSSWKMTKGGLVNLDERKKDDNSLGDFQDFNEVQLDGYFKAKIVQSETFYVTTDNKRKGFDARVNGNQLIITSNNNDRDAMVEIGLPELKAFNILNTDDVRISGFKQPKLEGFISGEQEVKFDINVEFLNLSINEEAIVDLKGFATQVEIELNDEAYLDADKIDITVGRIRLNEKGEGKVNIRDTLFTNDGSALRVIGDPVLIESE